MLQLCPKETQRKNKSLTRVKSIIKKPSCCWETTNAWKEPRQKKNFPLQQVPSINYCNGPSEANSGENLILLRQVLNIECRGHYGKPCGCTPLGFQLVIGWWLSGYFQVLRGYCLREKKTAVLRVNDPQWEASLQIFSFNWLCGCQRRRVFFLNRVPLIAPGSTWFAWFTSIMTQAHKKALSSQKGHQRAVGFWFERFFSEQNHFHFPFYPNITPEIFLHPEQLQKKSYFPDGCPFLFLPCRMRYNSIVLCTTGDQNQR